MPSAVALVPARSGSSRVPGKNVRALAGHPLIAYSIVAAQEAGVFDAVVVSTDDEHTAAVARHYGAEVPGLRPEAISGATSPDIAWIRHVLDDMDRDGRRFDLFALVRPTSPFRGAATIRRAFAQLVAQGGRTDSLRAVERCAQHPGKMWLVHGEELMTPLLMQPEELPFHSRQYQALPEVHIQNSSVEVAWTRVVTEDGTIAGRRVSPFFTDEQEGFSIDYPQDWETAERMVARGEASLPEIRAPRFDETAVQQ